MIATVLNKGSKESPKKVAIYTTSENYTYEELNKLVVKLASGLQQNFNLQKDDVVAIQSSNRIEFVITLYACWRIGVSVTTMNPALKPNEISNQLIDSQAKVYFYEKSCARKAVLALEKMPILPIRVLLDQEKNLDEIYFYEAFSDKEINEVNMMPETIALLIYTSGTTGKPKGVCLSHSNISSMLQGVVEFLQLNEGDRSYLILPLFHVNSIHFTLSAPLLVGGSVFLTNRFDSEQFLKNVDQYKPTFTVGVPTVYKMLMAIPAKTIAQYDLSSLRYGLCGGAPITVSEFNRIQEMYPFKLLEGYGLSEGAVCSTSNPIYGERKVGSIGIRFPGQQLKVVDEKGVEAPVGSAGELLIKGDNVMLGYLNNPEATAETIQNGWLYTGDLGFVDEDGYFYIVGRKKEVIIRGGINIYPKEIEEIIYEMPEVEEAAVIGVFDEKYGEEVICYASLRRGSTITELEIIDYCKEKIANYKCPKEIIFVEALPKNSVGKIVKNKLGK